jgi:hypothetical protein
LAWDVTGSSEKSLPLTMSIPKVNSSMTISFYSLHFSYCILARCNTSWHVAPHHFVVYLRIS